MPSSPSTANKFMDQHTWVQQCLDYYKENNLTPEPGGEWQEAHYPAPKGLGKDVIWLRFEDHQVQGLLQSEEYGRCCFYNPDVKTFLDNNWCYDWFYLYSLYEEWSGYYSKANIAKMPKEVLVANQTKIPKEVLSANGRASAAAMNAHENTQKS